MNVRRLWMSSLSGMEARHGLGRQGFSEPLVRSLAYGPARAARLLGAGVIGALLLATVLRTEGAEPAHARAAVASNIVVTAAQRQKLHTTTIQPSAFRRTIETTGTVGFDNDQATTVLSPVSGPVSRLVVSLGAKVKAGEVLATVASPDYATAISTYRKAVATAKNAHRIAELAEQLSHNNLSRKEVEQAQTDAANAEADREAALEELHSLGVDAATIQAIQENRPLSNLTGDIRSGAAVRRQRL